MIRRHVTNEGNSLLYHQCLLQQPLYPTTQYDHRDFHGNLTYGTMLGMELHIALNDYKSPKDPPSISHPPLPCCSRVAQMTTVMGLPIPWEHCQAELGIKFAGDYAILSSIFTLGMWRFTLHDASNITPNVKRDSTRF